MTSDSTPIILIVDDDPEITSALVRGLEMYDYEAVTESTVEGALARIREAKVSAAIIDVMIGEDSGITLVKKIRSEGNSKPILMLSALAEVEDRAMGLDAGANDYIVKPFSFDELLARLKVQVRRTGAFDDPASFLDAQTRVVRSPAGQISLTEREFALLEMLVAHKDIVISRGEIFDTLWADEGASSENVVDVYLGYLRKKLSDLQEFSFEIKTIRNRGFVFQSANSPKIKPD